MQTLTFAGSADESLGGSAGEAVQPDARGTRVDEALAGVEVGQPDVVRLGVSVPQPSPGARARRRARRARDRRRRRRRGRDPRVRRGRELADQRADRQAGGAARLHVVAAARQLAGPYDPVEGYQLGGSSLFDEGPSAAYANASGALPGDQPHRFFAELALRGRWRGLALDGGVRATAASGRPRSARIGRGQTFAVPRGALGRLPALTQANLHVGARRGRWSATLDVWNLFDRRGVVAVEESFARDASPIVGGDAGDLIWLKDDVVEGNPALRVDGYGQPTRYQAPISAIVAVAVEL
ncbi:MAG: hypothetical protein IPL61_12040 [Myxococcales bacterium]|nr:hypothetical protein [Myxococcales bacterium]